MNKITITALLVAASLPQLSLAQGLVPDDVKKESILHDLEEDQGWSLGGTLGGAVNFSDSRDVVGTTDGSTLQIGVLLSLKGEYKQGQHRWVTVLSVKEGQTRTPAIDAYVKSTDELELISTYYYRLLNPDWMGFFGQFKLNTQLFKSVYRAEDAFNARMIASDATVQQNLNNQSRVAVADSFAPLQLRESAGVFAQPYDTKPISLTVKLGAGFQHTIVGSGNYYYVETVTEAGTDWEVFKELEANNELGAELEADATGEVYPNALSWRLKVNLFYPLMVTEDIFNSDGEEMSDFELLNVDVAAGISAKLNPWLSLEYALSVKRAPAIADVWQVQNGIVATASFNLL